MNPQDLFTNIEDKLSCCIVVLVWLIVYIYVTCKQSPCLETIARNRMQNLINSNNVELAHNHNDIIRIEHDDDNNSNNGVISIVAANHNSTGSPHLPLRLNNSPIFVQRRCLENNSPSTLRKYRVLQEDKGSQSE